MHQLLKSMIEHLTKPYSVGESLGVLNPYVRKWFTERFDEMTPPQRYAFKLISEGKNVLIAAPTGSGKTMSAFLVIMSRLFDYSLAGKLEDKVYCVYVSPLRALNNDIYRNLSVPLEEIYGIIRQEKGIDLIKAHIKQVSIGVRTGDTSRRERQSQLAKPPNILVTTPESLAIILNSRRFIESFKDLEFFIMDEVHELAGNKRGVHLSLSVERLAATADHEFTRIGLGATLYPLEEAAMFLVGNDGAAQRHCTIVDASWSKKIDARVITPASDLIYTEDKRIEDNTYDEINRIIKGGKTTLIFTNTRSGTERVVFNLKRRFKYGEEVAAHHGSLSRSSRLEVEELLKKGSLRCAVSSTSLELGIDIGEIDNVVQLGSPKSVTRAVQRIGRAGHSFKSVAKGEIIVLNRDDMVECAVMLDAAMKRHLDSFSMPHNALDVLAQHIIGMSITKKWEVEEAYALVRRAYAYHRLEKHDFLSLLDYLAGNYVGLESRKVYGKIWYDKEAGTFGRRGALANMIYMTNLGTIPDEVSVSVYAAGGKWIGNIEEEFLARLQDGDVFALGGRLYRFERSAGMKCYVSEANSSVPTIPPWFSEQLPLSYELALEIGKLRQQLSALVSAEIEKSGAAALKAKRLPKPVSDYLSTMPIDGNTKRSLFSYFAEQLLFAGSVPHHKLLLIEQTSEVDGRSGEQLNYLIFHSLYGKRINDALSRLFGILLGDMLDEDIGMMVNDNGFVLTTAAAQRISYAAIKRLVRNATQCDAESTLRRNIRRTELMRRRFRHVAARSFMILRNYKGYHMSLGRQQVSSQALLNAAEEIDPEFPVIKETYREIFNDLMDLPRARAVLAGIASGDIAYDVIHTSVPSPFSHNMITFGHADVVMMAERRKYLQQLHKRIIKAIGAGAGAGATKRQRR